MPAIINKVEKMDRCAWMSVRRCRFRVECRRDIVKRHGEVGSHLVDELSPNFIPSTFEDHENDQGCDENRG